MSLPPSLDDYLEFRKTFHGTLSKKKVQVCLCKTTEIKTQKWNLRVQTGICSHHGEGHAHFHDIPDQRTSQETWNFHTNKAGEACCPFHQMLSLEAEDE